MDRTARTASAAPKPTPADQTDGPAAPPAPATGDDTQPNPDEGADQPGTNDPSDVAAEPRTHLVVLTDEADLGLVRGAVIAVREADVDELVVLDLARPATDAEVELAQPRVAPWNAPEKKAD